MTLSLKETYVYRDFFLKETFLYMALPSLETCQAAYV